MKEKTTCHICKKEIEHSGIGTGYARDKKDKKICYTCIGKLESRKLIRSKLGDKFIMYLVKENGKYKITNWPSSLIIPLYYGVRTGKHNIAGKRYDVWFKYADKYFHGVTYGDNTQICHIKTVKPF